MAQLSGTALFSDANLVSYYRLEDTSDSKGSNTLTNNNTVTFGAARYGNGADFGAANTNKSLTVASNLGIAGNGAMSVSFWIKLNAEIASGSWDFFAHNSLTTSAKYLSLKYEYNGGTIRFNLDNSANYYYNVALGATNWHHIVVTRNGSAQASVFLDNVQVITNQAQGAGTAGEDKFYIAAESGGGYASVIEDDMGIFSKALSTTEINTLYQPSAGFFAIL